MARTWKLAQSLDDLGDETNARWPNRPTQSDGIIGDAAHASRPSDHNPDEAGIVRARDITEWEAGTPDFEGDDVAEVIAETLRRNRDPRVKYVIWRGRMFSSYATRTRKAWEWGPYTGPNGHFKHVHVSVLPGDKGAASGPWGIYPTNTNNEEEDTMTEEQAANLISELGSLNGNLKLLLRQGEVSQAYLKALAEDAQLKVADVRKHDPLRFD